MMFRKITLSLAILVALTCVFAFNSQKGILSCWGLAECRFTHTDQTNCSPFNTGPVCTAAFGVLHPTAYLDNHCTTILRQP